MGVGACKSHSVVIRQQLVGSLHLSFHHKGSGAQTRVFRLGGKRLYLLGPRTTSLLWPTAFNQSSCMHIRDMAVWWGGSKETHFPGTFLLSGYLRLFSLASLQKACSYLFLGVLFTLRCSGVRDKAHKDIWFYLATTCVWPKTSWCYNLSSCTYGSTCLTSKVWLLFQIQPSSQKNLASKGLRVLICLIMSWKA